MYLCFFVKRFSDFSMRFEEKSVKFSVWRAQDSFGEMQFLSGNLASLQCSYVLLWRERETTKSHSCPQAAGNNLRCSQFTLWNTKKCCESSSSDFPRHFTRKSPLENCPPRTEAPFPVAGHISCRTRISCADCIAALKENKLFVFGGDFFLFFPHLFGEEIKISPSVGTPALTAG